MNQRLLINMPIRHKEPKYTASYHAGKRLTTLIT